MKIKKTVLVLFIGWSIFHLYRKRPLQVYILICYRIFIVALCVVSILWIPLLRSSQGGQLFAYINAVQSYLGTPIGALFLLAITWKRMSEQVPYFITAYKFSNCRLIHNKSNLAMLPKIPFSTGSVLGYSYRTFVWCYTAGPGHGLPRAWVRTWGHTTVHSGQSSLYLLRGSDDCHYVPRYRCHQPPH